MRQLTAHADGVATDNIPAARYSSVTRVTSEKSMFDSRLLQESKSVLGLTEAQGAVGARSKGLGVKVGIHFRLVQRLTMSEAVPPVPPVSTARTTGLLHCCTQKM